MKSTHLIEDTLIKNYYKYYKLAYSYTQNETDALDIVQEGAYKSILKSSSLKNPIYVETWIYKIMINEAKSFLLKNKKPYTPLEDTVIRVEDTYSNIDLKNALNILEQTDKSIVILKFFEDLTIEEISNILNINLNTIKSKLYRALKKLESLMEV